MHAPGAGKNNNEMRKSIKIISTAPPPQMHAPGAGMSNRDPL